MDTGGSATQGAIAGCIYQYMSIVSCFLTKYQNKSLPPRNKKATD